jgi:uncharacterized C2H2 Zn-finger protein
MTAGIIIGQRCNRCSKFFSPSDLLIYSMEKHEKALHFFGGGPPPEACQECGCSFGLSEADKDVKVVMKDGIVQILCLPCGAKYEQQRKDYLMPAGEIR